MRDSIFTATVSFRQQSDPLKGRETLGQVSVQSHATEQTSETEITNNDSHLEFSWEIIWSDLYCTYLNLHTSLPWYYLGYLLTLENRLHEKMSHQ